MPSNPVLGFINDLLEDYGDEWLTKAMFHYRWYYQDDITTAGKILPRWSNNTAPEDQLSEMGEFISQRQISRLYVVGSNDITAPVIEASYLRFYRYLTPCCSVIPLSWVIGLAAPISLFMPS